MDLHCTFQTRAFADPPDVLAQSVNRIHGRALADFLVQRLKAAGLEPGEPWVEDHGWDFAIVEPGARWLVACALQGDTDESPEAATGATWEGHVSLSKVRSMSDRLRGRNRFDRAEAVPAAIIAALAQCTDVQGLRSEL